jgi:hypothetical protein
MATSAARVPVHLMSWAGIVMAAVAGVLALYGSMHAEKHLAHSPLREARGSSGLPAKPETALGRQVVKAEASVFGGDVDAKLLDLTGRSRVANYSLQIVAFVLPFWLGLAAALTGGWAMKQVQASGGKYAGNTLAVFAMMVGGLAAVVAGCMMMSLYVWPHVPSLYTT